jgi:hypothetical protein
VWGLFCSLNINIDNSSISSARIEVFAPVRENFLAQEIQTLESLETSRTNPWLSDQGSLHADPPLASTPRLALRFSRLLSNGYMGLFTVAQSQQIQVPLSRGVRLPVPLWRKGVVFFTGKLFMLYLSLPWLSSRSFHAVTKWRLRRGYWPFPANPHGRVISLISKYTHEPVK